MVPPQPGECDGEDEEEDEDDDAYEAVAVIRVMMLCGLEAHAMHTHTHIYTHSQMMCRGPLPHAKPSRAHEHIDAFISGGVWRISAHNLRQFPPVLHGLVRL